MNTRCFEPIQKGFCVLMIMTLFSLSHEMVHGQDGDELVIGKTVKMNSEILEKEVHLSIHIPADYKTSDQRYPVLYLFQTHFEQAAGAVEMLYDYNTTPELICVQIDNYEFGYLTPTKIENDPNSGQADRFLRFFREELLPFMDSYYPVQDYRIVFSNSWGAAFIVYAILTQPDLFNAGIASIPWVNYENQNHYILQNAESILKSESYHNNYLYMTMDDESVLLPDLEAFIAILKNNPRPGPEWEYHHWPEEDHRSTPYRSIYSGLQALFENWSRIPDEIGNKGLEEIKKYELGVKKEFGYDIGISIMALHIAGIKLKREKRYEDAAAIFLYSLEKDPDNASAYVNLGRVYEESNKLDLAKKAYEKGYRIAVSTSHPQIKWIKSFLDRINKKIMDIEHN